MGSCKSFIAAVAGLALLALPTPAQPLPKGPGSGRGAADQYTGDQDPADQYAPAAPAGPLGANGGPPAPPGAAEAYTTTSSAPASSTTSYSSSSVPSAGIFVTVTGASSAVVSVSVGARSTSSAAGSSTSTTICTDSNTAAAATSSSARPSSTTFLTNGRTSSRALSSTATSSIMQDVTQYTPQSSNSSSSGADVGPRSNRVLVITLSTVFSIIGLALLLGGAFIWWKRRERRRGGFGRGLTPIDDEEIEAWRTARSEKGGPAAGGGGYTTSNHARNISASSGPQAPSVIVYQNPQPTQTRWSEISEPSAFGATLSRDFGYGQNQDVLQSPAQARAPNSRVGLTDEAIPGAEPFVVSPVSPRRRPSKLSKESPLSSPRSAHTRTRSTRSTRSSTSHRASVDRNRLTVGGGDVELSPRFSHDYQSTIPRDYSTSTMAPPRLSHSDEELVGGLSPRPTNRDVEIGRAIG